MLVSNILKSSLRKIGALSVGETLETDRQNEALEALQVMLRSWGSAGHAVLCPVMEEVTLIAGKGYYTWGSGGDIDTARPNKLAGAYVKDANGISCPVDILLESEFRNITSKTAGGRPSAVWLYPAHPLATLYVHPVTEVSETLCIDSYKQFTETSSFTLATDTISFPAFYEEAIIYNLAIRLAPEYGRSASPEVTFVATESLKELKRVNALSRVEPVMLRIPASGIEGVRYSINSDAYR